MQSQECVYYHDKAHTSWACSKRAEANKDSKIGWEQNRGNDKLNGVDIKMEVDIGASGSIIQTCLADVWEILLGIFQSFELSNPYGV